MKTVLQIGIVLQLLLLATNAWFMWLPEGGIHHLWYAVINIVGIAACFAALRSLRELA